MGGFSMMHWVIVAVVALVLFGRGRISETMGDFGRGITSFRRGLNAADEPGKLPPPSTETATTHAQRAKAPDAAE